MILLINIRFATCEARRLTRALACERRRISGRRLSPPSGVQVTRRPEIRLGSQATRALATTATTAVRNVLVKYLSVFKTSWRLFYLSQLVKCSRIFWNQNIVPDRTLVQKGS